MPKNKALALLKIIEERNKEYYSLNRLINLDELPNFGQAIDSRIETAVVDLLDKILGEGIASYWLYGPAGGGTFYRDEDGKPVKYTIKTFEDVKKLCQNTTTA